MVETSRLRVRNTWESLMNGTLTEIESACEIMISTIKKIENKFINIQNYHSNNQYSLRAQASFMKEVLADYDAYDDLLSKIKMIVSGRSLDADQPYLYGHYYFKNLPERIAKKTFQNHEILGGQTTSSFESIAITNQELKFPVEQRTLYTVIRNSIDKLTFPLIRTKIILHISYFIVFCFVPFLAYLFFYNDFIKYLKLPLDVLAHTSYFRDSFGTYTGCIVRYYFEEQNLIPDQCHNHDFGDEFFELQYPNIGGSCKSKQQIQYFSYRSMLALGFLNDYVKLDINNPKFIAGKSILMHNIYNFSYYSDTFSNETSFYNHFSTIQQKVVSLSESGLLLFENSTKHSINESELISTILINYYTINQYINIASEDFLEFSNHRVYKTLQFISILEITIPIFFVITYGALTIIMTNLIRKLKLKLFCSSQALPKNVLQTMINKLDTSLLNGSSNTLTHTTGFIRQAEEETPENKNKFIHAMSLFRTGERSRKTTNLKVMIFLSISMLVLLISEFIFAAEHFQYIGETYLQFSPYTHLLSIAYSYSLQAMIYLNVYIHYNSFFEKIGLNRSQVFLQYHESRDISLHHFYDFLERNQTDFFGALFHAEVEDPTTEIPPDSRSMENSILKLNASQIQISNHKYSKNAKLQNLSKNKNIASKLNETELHDIFKELPLVQMYYLFVEIMDVVSHTKCNHSQDATFLLGNESYSPEIVEYLISELWHLQLFHLYSNYLDPLLSQIYYKSDTVLSQHKFVLYIVTIFFTIMEVIVLIFLVDRLNAITYKVRISLRLLLHAPPDVVLSSSYISSILSGDFKSLYKSKTAELDKNLYSLAAKHFPCAFLSVNKSGEIFKKNKLATDIFGDILFLPFEFSTNENDITVVEYHEKHFNVVTMKDIEDHNQFVLVFQDITDEFTMKNRIKEEKIKLENLINLFLPTELMEIYKFGKSVSLLIPQTTIISIAVHEDSYDRSFKSLQNPEIDEAANTNYYNNNNNNHYKVDTQQNNFTRIPPCLTSGSLSPISNHLINDPQSRHISHTCSTNNISNILNINNASNQNNINSKNHLAQEEEEDIKEVCKSDNVFEQLLFMMNNLIDKFPNLTTVELVADRFYVFGNFQGKSNEASQIAKEIIEFGLNVLMFAIQTNIKLQIGVVSGGPLSIGVIGKDMPHFEFIGDIIDFANRICTNASENLIHLARSTYELIYDGNFDIKVKNEEKSSTTTGNALIYTISL
ncbi:hypothetical protein TRFO_33035 [Tritrichomonas foetus]|uniref:Guanylate cyclase domain-containing protein n=1 Tax=Tritrichomonas foetus TaxID=1144522 RepID=A0A1J4JRZ7_9EUKA|nr:hypothetical protein TRFO_33035 [Tritrichomonas foetus]|eukprot:OHT00284.1 hypothetical protein TRFO_33035 [Tritrichomonas foetus]